MQAQSAAFLAAVATSHTKTLKAEVLSPAGAVVATLAPHEGTVTVDRTAANRRVADVTLADPDGHLVPSTTLGGGQVSYGEATDHFGDLGGQYGYFRADVWNGPLAPYGNELRLTHGVVLPDGSTEWCPLGLFTITDLDANDTTDGLTIKVAGVDRSFLVSVAKWPDVFVVAAGTNVGTAIQNIVTDRLQGRAVTFDFVAVTGTTPQLVYGLDPDGDPWKDACELAGSVGCELFFAPDGTCVLQPIPDPTTQTAVATVSEADVMLRAEKVLSRKSAVNGVIVVSTPSGATGPVRGEAWDTNSASPTNTTGPWKKVPKVVKTDLVTTDADATTMASSLLRNLLGLDEVVTVDMVPNPALDASDVVFLLRGRSALNANYVVQRITYNVKPDTPAAVELRRRSAAS